MFGMSLILMRQISFLFKLIKVLLDLDSRFWNPNFRSFFCIKTFKSKADHQTILDYLGLGKEERLNWNL